MHHPCALNEYFGAVSKNLSFKKVKAQYGHWAYADYSGLFYCIN